jgi:hypothetical protein
MDKVDLNFLSMNKNAISILKNNLNKINWITILYNSNASEIVEQNIHMIQLESININIKKININIYLLLCKYNLVKIDYEYLSNKREIFELDYLKIKQNNTLFESIVQKTDHPRKILKNRMKYNFTDI